VYLGDSLSLTIGLDLDFEGQSPGYAGRIVELRCRVLYEVSRNDELENAHPHFNLFARKVQIHGGLFDKRNILA